MCESLKLPHDIVSAIHSVDLFIEMRLEYLGKGKKRFAYIFATSGNILLVFVFRHL